MESSPTINRSHWKTAVLLYRNQLLAIIALFLVVCVGGKLLTTTKYEAYTVLVPQNQQGGGLADMLGGLGGLTSLAGINLGGSGVDNTKFAIELLESRRFLLHVIEKYDWTPLLIAVESWDQENGLQVDETRLEQPANPWQAYGELKDSFVVMADAASGTVQLTLQHQSPEVAAEWLNIIVDELNAMMREREQEHIKQRIDYLSQQVENTEVAQIETALYSLLQEQFKQQMLTEVNEDHVFEIIDPPYVPHQPAGLSVLVWAALGLVLGLITAFVVTFSRAYRFASKEQSITHIQTEK